MTYEEWLAWPDGESKQSEWVDGEVILFMPPKTVHALLGFFLARLLASYADLFGLGQVIPAPFEMRLARSAREPDLLFVARAHLDRLTPERLVGPADLVVELISDSSVRRDRLEKFTEYAMAGVPEYWLFDPRPGRQQALFHQLNEEGVYEAITPDAEGRYFSVALPGFWLRTEWLWQSPLPSPAACLAEIASVTGDRPSSAGKP
ncbi:MAG: Uma2 family endonuclease [Chloroflexota bacterium]|nr:Uma2 family endonuclease [Chloroflexota bacterium]